MSRTRRNFTAQFKAKLVAVAFNQSSFVQKQDSFSWESLACQFSNLRFELSLFAQVENCASEVLKGEKDINTIATENNIQPNLLRNWKKEFLDNASIVFDDKREENIKEKLASERKEKAEYAKKVGQLTMQVDWLKKKSEELLGPDYESKFSKKPFEE